MNRIDDDVILEAMQTYGGSFAKAIAFAATKADSDNYKRLRAAFPELWERYDAMRIVCVGGVCVPVFLASSKNK